jgi:hypothetical protein
MATKMRRARVQDADDELVVMPNVPTKLLKLRSRMNARNKTCAAAGQIVTKLPVVQSMNVTKVPFSCCACGACHSPTAPIDTIAFFLASVPPNIHADEGALQGCTHCQGVLSMCHYPVWGAQRYCPRAEQLARSSAAAGSKYGHFAFGFHLQFIGSVYKRTRALGPRKSC